MYDEQMRISRWFCDRKSCLCEGKKWSDKLAHRECVKQRNDLLGRNGCALGNKLLSSLFGVARDGGDGDILVAPSLTIGDDHGRNGGVELMHAARLIESVQGNVSDDEASDSEDDRPLVGPTLERREGECIVDKKQQWIYFKAPDSVRCTPVMELLLENINFALGEPITLGFIPYVTQNTDEEDVEEPADEMNVEECVQSNVTHVLRDGAMDTAAQDHWRRNDDRMWTEWSRRYFSVLDKATDNVENCFETSYTQEAINRHAFC